jgi:hypothetical protein
MAGFEECVARLARLKGISPADARDIFQQVHDLGQEYKATGEASPNLKAAIDLAQKFKEEAQRKRLSAVRNAAKRIEMRNEVRPFLSNVKTLVKNIRGMIHWEAGTENMRSASSNWHQLYKAYVSSVMTDVEQAGLRDYAIAGNDDYGVAEAMSRLGGNKPHDNVTISPQAQKLAEILYTAREGLKERLNAAGANIGTAEDFVNSTAWDARQLRNAAGSRSLLARIMGRAPTPEEAFQAWLERDVPRMGNKFFKDITPKEGETMEVAKDRAIRSFWNAVVSGMHMTTSWTTGADEAFIPRAYEGTYNIAKGLSHARVTDWKSPKDWVDHMREFGGGQSIFSHFMTRTFDHGARSLALMDRFGENAEGNFQSLLDWAVKELRDKDVDEFNKFKSQIPRLQQAFKFLTGEANMPVNVHRAELVNGLLTWESVSHLGGLGVTHGTALPLTASAALKTHAGVNHLEGIRNVIGSMFESRGSESKQDIGAGAGAFVHGHLMAIQRHWRKDTGIPGALSWGAAHFLRMTGFNYLIDHAQGYGGKYYIMNLLAESASKEFHELEPHLQDMLPRYGIGKELWDLMREVGPVEADGRKYLTPDAAMNIDPAKIEQILRDKGAQWPGRELFKETGYPEEFQKQIDLAVKQYQWEAADSYMMYLNDIADGMTVTPGIKEREIASRILPNHGPGEWGWVVRRAIAQFKMWPLAAIHQILIKNYYHSLSRPEMLGNFGFIIGLTLLGGVARNSLNDYLSGRPQRSYDPLTSDGWLGLLSGAAAGGGLGIWGDFLLGSLNRAGADMWATAAGPLTSDVNAFYKIIHRGLADILNKNAKPGTTLNHLLPDLAHFTVNHIPFANLVYIKGALDYLLFYHMFEAASPGWWERTNRRLEKEQGRTMYGYTPGGRIPYGLPGIYMQQGNRTSGLLGANQ